MNVTKLLIARHGNTFGPNDVARRVGITDLPLVDSGFLQGKKLGEYLKREQLLPDIIFTSELKRARQTAEEVIKVLSSSPVIKPLSIFNEIDYGPDENLPEAQVVARVGTQALQEWEGKAVVPNGWKVNPQQIIADWQSFAQQIASNFMGKTILVVTSNGIARFSPYLTGNFAAFCAQHRIKIATGAICIFKKQDSFAHWDCVGWNIKPSKEFETKL